MPQPRQRKGDQPLPQVGNVDVGPEVIRDVKVHADYRGEALIKTVVADFEARIQLGIERYGHPLQTNNGRDAARDALDELLDAAHYLKQLKIETYDPKVRLVYWNVLGCLLDLREWMNRQESRTPGEGVTA